MLLLSIPEFVSFKGYEEILQEDILSWISFSVALTYEAFDIRGNSAYNK